MTRCAEPARYYADLNPRHGSWQQRRYAVFLRRCCRGPREGTDGGTAPCRECRKPH